MDRGAWWASVHGVTQSQIRLSDFTHFTHSVVLVSGVQKSASVIHKHMSTLFWDSLPILAFTEYWVQFSVLSSRFLQVIYFIYGSVYKSIPGSEFIPPLLFPGLPWWLTGKESSCQCRNCQFDLWVEKVPLRRKCGNSLQYSCLENPMDKGAWWGYSPWGCKGLDITYQLSMSTRIIPW